VVVNVSRAVVAAARGKFEFVQVLNITAPPEALAARLVARARETADDISRRVARAGQFALAGDDVLELVNDSDIETGVSRLVEALRAS
jgi:phosphonate metabolism protein PhnN/1,5-bisphosphokinase (PRPP-forming)